MTLPACGYVGLDDADVMQDVTDARPGGLGGASSGGQGNGDATTRSGGRDGAGTNSGGRDASGGADPTGGANAAGGTKATGGTQNTGGETSLGVIFSDPLDGPVFPGIEVELRENLRFVESPARNGTPVLEATQGLPDRVLITHDFAPVTEAHLYFRGWLYVPEGVINGSLKLVGLHADGVPGLDVNLLPDRVLEFFDHSGDQSARTDAEKVPNNQWFCLQLDLKVSEVGGANASIDGSPSVSITSVNLAREGGASSLDYGLPFSSFGQSGGKVYWDDVTLSHEPVSCD